MTNRLRKTEGQKYVISIGDDEDPMVYTRIGLINTNASLASTLNFETAELPDLDDFDKPYDITRTMKSHDYKVEGAGMIDARYIADLLDLHIGERAGQTVPLKIQLVVPSGGGGYTITGRFYLESLTENAQYKTSAEVQMSWVKEGNLTFTKGTVTP